MKEPSYYLTPKGAEAIRVAIVSMREFMAMKRALRALERSKGGK